MALLYGRAGRLTAENGGFRPGQWPGARYRHAAWAMRAGRDPGRRPPSVQAYPLYVFGGLGVADEG
jgi:hypothetical protein